MQTDQLDPFGVAKDDF